MLMLDNHGDLNNANDLGQTPLAFAIPSTLKRLDLENAIATTNSSSIHNFDNNKFLKSKNPEVFKMNEFCSFNLEKMSLPSDKVRLIDSNLITHIVSFPETVINKNDIKANENIDIYMNNKKEQAIDTSSFKKKRNITLNQIKI